MAGLLEAAGTAVTPTLLALALLFQDYKIAASGVAQGAILPERPIEAETLFDASVQSAAENRLRIRDLTSAIAREFFLNNYRRGESLLAELKALKPQNGIDLYYDAILQVQKGNFTTAIFQLDATLKKNPELDPAWNLLGYLHSRAGDQTRALAAFRRAIAFEPYQPVYRYNFARALWLTGSHQPALEEVDRVLELRDNMPEAYFLKGLILEDTKRDAEALQQYRKAEERGLTDEDFYVHFFKLGVKLESSTDLLRLLERTKDSSHADLMRMQSITRMKAGEYQRALDYNRRLLTAGLYLDEDLARTGQILCRSQRPLATLRDMRLEDRVLNRIRQSYETCEASERKGPIVRDPLVHPAL